jgi:prevent-host-death family protein
MNIGVRELKQNLSENLDTAANGELVVVTDRGIPKALIVAIPGGDQMSLNVYVFLQFVLLLSTFVKRLQHVHLDFQLWVLSSLERRDVADFRRHFSRN